MRTVSAFALALVLFALPAAGHAQITVSRADVLAQLGRTGTVKSFEATPNATAFATLMARTGASQTWDFTALAWGAADEVSLEPAALPAPGSSDPHLAQATHVLKSGRADSTGYLYQRLTSTALETLGVTGTVVDEGTEVPFMIKFVPPQVEMPVPLTASSTWSSAYTYDMGIEGFSLSFDEQSAVEGWGTLKTPDGSAGALRVRTRTIARTSFDLGGNTIVTIDTSYSVSFITRTGLSATLYLADASEVADADYSTFSGTGTAVEGGEAPALPVRLAVEGPSPARPGTALTVTFGLDRPAAVRLDCYDVLGRRVARIAEGTYGAGQHAATWQTDGLPAGLYLVQISADGQKATRSVVLAQ